MTHYLCISLTFLGDLFHGKGDREEPEWPPSPWRLFQSLLAGSLAGCRKNGWPDARADAFRWLEQRNPPLILAPEARRALAYEFYVPKNESDKAPRREDRLDTKVARPHRLMNGNTVRYLWAIDEQEWPSAQRDVELLASEARRLLSLGWGVDLVVGEGTVFAGDQVRMLDGQRWRPSNMWLETGMSRAPVEASLNDLEKTYQQFLSSVRNNIFHLRSEPTVFQKVSYVRETAMPPRPTATFELRKPNGNWGTFRHVSAAKVAAMLRQLASDSANNDSHVFSGGWQRYVKGEKIDAREASPQFSYLPLPTTRHKHADGLIRRVLIAEPFGGDGAQAEWAAQRLIGQDLIDEHGEILATLSSPESRETRTILGAYIDPAKLWSTITPVILPGFDDGKYEKAKRLFVKALEHCGLPVEAVEDIVLRKAPFWSGSQHPRLYYRPDYLKDYSAWHVHIRFREDIAGPIAIGSGRYCGLGLFASDKEQVETVTNDHAN
ncbi:MAG: type I-G CRISPR-associated protein Csb2 [Pyrinomonadaceae bacterium]